MSKMFPFITKTWNPITGYCHYSCHYCWARRFAARRKMAKYIQASVWVDLVAMQKKFTEKDFVFVQDMSDLFGNWVDSKWIQQVLDYIEKSPAKFLLLTKNPKRYQEFNLPKNAVAGASIESDCDHLVSDAPKVRDRLIAMFELQHKPKMVSIEPVLRFSTDFARQLKKLDLDFVAVGYDNYNNGLDEPTLDSVNELVENLEEANVLVYLKTMREPSISQEQTRGN